MWKNIRTVSLVVIGALMTVSCDKIEDMVGSVVGEAEPKDRRMGIKEPYQASIVDAEKWIAEPNVLVVLDFYSENCRPCKLIEPHLTELAAVYGEKAAVMKLNVGVPGETADKAINEYGVQSTPILKFYLNGKEVEELRGAQSKEEIDVVFKKFTDKIDGEYTMREGEMPGMAKKEKTIEEMMARVSKDALPEGITRVKIPEGEKVITDENPERLLHKNADQPTRLTAPVSPN